MARPDAAKSIQIHVDAARDALTEAIAEHPDHARRVAEALKALREIEKAIESEDTFRRGSPRKGPKPARAVERYAAEQRDGRWYLAEFRSSHGQPFRCPRATLDLTAEVLAGMKQARFIELHQAVCQAQGEAVPDFHVRTALRFLKSEKLVEHRSARFAVQTTGPGKWTNKVERAWRRLGSA